MAKTIAIIGGTGRMGRWFARFFKERGLRVVIHSRSTARAASTAKEVGVEYSESIEGALCSDLVLVATPIGVTARLIDEISMKLRAGTILFDIASVKGDIVRALEDAGASGARPVSVHPLFGPGAESIEGKTVLIIPVDKDPTLIQEVKRLFEGARVQIVDSVEEHDRMMALTLSLPHFLNIVFGKILSNNDILRLKRFSGTTFNLQLLIAESVFTEDPNLYYEIQSQNEYFGEVLDRLTTVVKETCSVVKKGERERFVEDFKKIEGFLSKDHEFLKAYERFYRALSGSRL